MQFKMSPRCCHLFFKHYSTTDKFCSLFFFFLYFMSCESWNIFPFFFFFFERLGANIYVLIFLQAAFSNKKAVHVAPMYVITKKLRRKSGCRQSLEKAFWMWDMGRSGKVEGLLAFAGSNQQLLSHDLYTRVIRQLQVVDAGHDWGQEVIWVLRWLKGLSYNCQGRVQTPETWEEGKTFAQVSVRSRLN